MERNEIAELKGFVQMPQLRLSVHHHFFSQFNHCMMVSLVNKALKVCHQEFFRFSEAVCWAQSAHMSELGVTSHFAPHVHTTTWNMGQFSGSVLC